MKNNSAPEFQNTPPAAVKPPGKLPKIAYNLALLSVFSVPLKLSISLIFIIPFVGLWLYGNFKNFNHIINRPAHSHLRPLFIFIIAAIYSCFFGIDMQRSLSNFPSLIFFSFIPFAVAEIMSKNKNGFIHITTALLAGQGLAGLHSLFEACFPQFSYQIFLGKVTESGQIAMSFLLALGLLFYLYKNNSYSKKYMFITISSMLLLSLTLLINLKRGPWMGVILASAVFLSMFSKKFVFPFISVVVAIFVLVSPIRNRILSSYDDFSIHGGREVIWDIGSELSLRYPLGIGFDNSHVLRKFSTEIPEELRHFHNNLLNILVETGWLGLFIYIWWIITIIRNCWRRFPDKKQQLIAKALGCAIISWQIAGLVEYNFGDSEIFILAMVILGLISGLNDPSYRAKKNTTVA